jgi:hypothetical protein
MNRREFIAGLGCAAVAWPKALADRKDMQTTLAE